MSNYEYLLQNEIFINIRIFNVIYFETINLIIRKRNIDFKKKRIYI